MVNSILNFLKKKQASKDETSPEGFCPNCWGRQEYGGQFLEAVKNHNVDINSDNPNLGWVQDYANKHLSGIKLRQENDELVCQKCKLTYQPK